MTTDYTAALERLDRIKQTNIRTNGERQAEEDAARIRALNAEIRLLKAELFKLRRQRR